jgi:hypothetical protein
MIDADTKRHIRFLGLGGETTLDKDKFGLADAKNLAEKDDPVPHQLNGASWWNRGPDPEEFDFPDAAGLDAHSWDNVYLEYLRTNPKILSDWKNCGKK